MSDTRAEELNKAKAALRERLPVNPTLALVLGSGLSEAFGIPEGGVRIPWTKIPEFPLPTVAGHAGEFWAGEIHGKPVVAFLPVDPVVSLLSQFLGCVVHFRGMEAFGRARLGQLRGHAEQRLVHQKTHRLRPKRIVARYGGEIIFHSR